jgi:hypothetical protein
LKRQHQQPAVDFSNATLEDLVANPNKFGAPTFEQYTKARDKWNPQVRDDESMIMLTDGPTKFRKDLKKIIFKVHGKEMVQEQVERALSDFGYGLADIDLENQRSTLKKEINMVPQGGGKYDVVVNFLP